MHAVANYVKENYSEEKYFKELYLVAKLHYIGKPYTQFFDGETAHYYGHESVEAYDSLFIAYDELVAFLINYHMRPFSMKTEKTRN